MKMKIKLLTEKDFADLLGKICIMLGFAYRKPVESLTSDVGARREGAAQKGALASEREN